MNESTSGVGGYFEAVPAQVRRFKWLVWLFFIAMTVVSFAGMERVKFDMTIEGWFADDDPTMVALDGFHAEFGSDDHVIVVYKPKDGDVFSQKSLEMVYKVRQDLLAARTAGGDDGPLSRMMRVTDLVNAPVFKAEGDSLITRHLVGENIPSNPQQLEQIRQTALGQKTFPLLYFAENYQYGGIFIETNFGAIPVDEEGEEEALSDDEMGQDLEMSFDAFDETEYTQERIRFKPTDMAEYLEFMNAVKAVIEKPEYLEHFEYHPVGNAAATEYDVKMLEEMGMLYMMMIVIMVVILWFLFRSLCGILWPMSVVILSCIWAIGITGWLGFTVTAFIILTVVMVLAVGIADSIHIMSGYLYFRKQGNGHVDALRLSFKKSAKAILLTTVTTMIAMLALTLTPIVPIKVFGFMTAFGIFLCFLFSIYLLPLMLDLWSPVAKVEKEPNAISRVFAKVLPDFTVFLQRRLDSVLPLVQRQHKAIVAIFAVVFAICLYGATNIRVDTDPIAQYPQDSKIRKSFEIADRDMIGTQTMEIYIDLGAEYALHDPQVLRTINALQDKLEQDYSKYVVRTQSLVEVVKDSYQTLNENRAEMYKIPESPQMLAQTLFLFDNSNPVDRRKMVSDDYMRTHISVYLHNAGSYEYTKVFADMRKDIEASLATLNDNYPDAKVDITGMFTLIMQGSDYLSWSSLTSFGLVVVIISILLLLVFGSFQAGVISIIPNLIPAVLTFGIMGLLDIPMDFTTVMIAPIIIGIAVDDTIHFLTHYRNEVMIDGDINRALKETIHEVGQAVTFTTLILGLGLSVLAMSTSVGNANVGIFGSLAIFAALACDLFLLPALAIMFNLKFNTQSKAENASANAYVEEQA